jgi:hypothetical protein
MVPSHEIYLSPNGSRAGLLFTSEAEDIHVVRTRLLMLGLAGGDETNVTRRKVLGVGIHIQWRNSN